MRLLPAIFRVLGGVILGAVILPVIMFVLFRAFASFGGDIPQILRRFGSPHGTLELRALCFYSVLGGSLGALTGYLFFCLSNQNWKVWARFCLAVVAFSLLSLIGGWIKFTTDGYNTVTEAILLLLLPTIWSVSLLALGFATLFKRLIKQV